MKLKIEIKLTHINIKINLHYFFCVLGCLLLFNNCGLDDDLRTKNTPTSGTLEINYEDGLKHIMQTQLYTFKETYPNANFVTKTFPDNICIQNLFNNTCQAILISRGLTTQELNKFTQNNITVQGSKVGCSAVIFIANKSFETDFLFNEDIVTILKNQNKLSHKYFFYLENSKTSNAYFLRDSIAKTKHIYNCFNAKCIDSLLLILQQNENCIGICDYAWLSETASVRVKNILKYIKILAIANANDTQAYFPDVSNIALRRYPYIKSLYVYRRGGDFSLSKGLETFIAGPIGQAMILKQGIYPNRQEERKVGIK